MSKWTIGLTSLLVCTVLQASAWACQTASGELAKIDVKAQTVALAKSSCGSDGGCGSEMTFRLAKSTKVLINGKQASLADLKAGDKVKIDYEKLDDVLSISATRQG
jgi:positive regulator of sigma E activity